MKTKILLTLIFAVLVQFSFAQPYESLFGNINTSWKIVFANLDILETDSLYTGNDSTINSMVYKKIFHPYTVPYNFFGLLREDTIAGKAWFYSLSDTTERLIMDLNLVVGDSFLVCANWLVNPGWKMVDYVYYSYGRKYIRIDCLTEWGDKLIFIEGIGTNVGIQYLSQNNLNIAPYLLCSYKDSQLIYINNNPNFNQCELITSIWEEKNPEQAIKITPNPFSDYITITNINNHNSCEYKIYSPIGQLIYHKKCIGNQTTLNLKNLNPGIYFFIINDKSEILKTQKIIKY
jgi:hypothetical protein